MTEFGVAFAEEKGSSVTKEATMPILSEKECQGLSTSYKKVLTDNMMCCGILHGNLDSCTGDSGGPLVCKNNENYEQAGVVSFGSANCGSRNTVGVYQRVSKYLKWIADKTGVKISG